MDLCHLSSWVPAQSHMVQLVLSLPLYLIQFFPPLWPAPAGLSPAPDSETVFTLTLQPVLTFVKVQILLINLYFYISPGSPSSVTKP